MELSVRRLFFVDRRQSAPLLFESTLAALYKLPDKTETPVPLQHWSSWWARVDYASRASKKAPQGPFCRRDVWRRALRVALADFSATPWRGLEKSERCPSLASLFPPQADGLRHPASAAPCLRIAGRGPNNSSLLPPLAALVVVAVGSAAVRIHPWICFEKFRTKEKLQHLHDAGVFGGRGWIRTTEAEKQQIYSLSPLATREHAHILFVSVAGRLAYFIIGFWICQPLFFISFLFLSIQ